MRDVTTFFYTVALIFSLASDFSEKSNFRELCLLNCNKQFTNHLFFFIHLQEIK